MVEGERVFQTVGGHLAVGPEPADVVQQHVQPRVSGQDLVGQPPDLGLRRHVGYEGIDRRVA